MARSSKDLARRLRFDRFPLPDGFRRHYFAAGLAATAGGAAIWLLFAVALGPRQYLPGPVSQNHATFAMRCQACHVDFHGAPDRQCATCHVERTHSRFDAHPAACAVCHVEHREAGRFAEVSRIACVECHGRLQSTRTPPIVQASLRSFADHPELTPLRPGQTDRAAIRFNHKLHLSSDKVLPDQKLRCASCHTADGSGKLMQPIVFDSHCRRCHEQKVKELPAPLGDVEAPHKTPDYIRARLSAELAAVAAGDSDLLFEGRPSTLPGIADRPPIDASRTLREYQNTWLGKIESALYKPFQDTRPLLESNKYCFLCHEEGAERAAGELPKVKQTDIPKRWLRFGEFSHRRHDLLECASCHPGIARSELTSDVNLPGKAVCLKCHIDDRRESAGTDCMLCHLYHDVTRDPALRAARPKTVSLGKLLGAE